MWQLYIIISKYIGRLSFQKQVSFVKNKKRLQQDCSAVEGAWETKTYKWLTKRLLSSIYALLLLGWRGRGVGGLARPSTIEQMREEEGYRSEVSGIGLSPSESEHPGLRIRPEATFEEATPSRRAMHDCGWSQHSGSRNAHNSYAPSFFVPECCHSSLSHRKATGTDKRHQSKFCTRAGAGPGRSGVSGRVGTDG